MKVTNTSNSKIIYIKVTDGEEILHSDMNKERTFKKLFFTSASNADHFKNVMKTMGLIDATNLKTEAYQTLFGAATVTTSKSDYYNHLRTVMRLELTQPVKKKLDHVDTGLPVTVGWGT